MLQEDFNGMKNENLFVFTVTTCMLGNWKFFSYIVESVFHYIVVAFYIVRLADQKDSNTSR